MAMFDLNLTLDGHTRRFVIQARDAHGWNVREELDSTVVRERVYDDWHRVERARSVFEEEIQALTAQGWRLEASAYSTNR